MAATNEPFDWPNYYGKVFKGRDLPGIDGYDALTDSYLNEVTSLSDLIPDNKFNFIVAPLARKKVVCLHYNMIINERIIGIFGTRSASPLYELDLTDSARPMTIPTATRNRKNTVMLPGIEDFEKLLNIGASLSSIHLRRVLHGL